MVVGECEERYLLGAALAEGFGKGVRSTRCRTQRVHAVRAADLAGQVASIPIRKVSLDNDGFRKSHADRRFLQVQNFSEQKVLCAEKSNPLAGFV